MTVQFVGFLWKLLSCFGFKEPRENASASNKNGGSPYPDDDDMVVARLEIFANMWNTFDCRVTGASHERSGVPCQDHSTTAVLGNCSVGALSDGHGGAKYVRSALGAEFAAQAFIEFFDDAMTGRGEDIATFADVGPIQRSWIDEIKRKAGPSILERWRSKVEAHRNVAPITEDELRRYLDSKPDGSIGDLLEAPGPESQGQIETENGKTEGATVPLLELGSGFSETGSDANFGPQDEQVQVTSDAAKGTLRALCYGATLIGYFATPRHILVAQLGDGDVVVVDRDGHTEAPFGMPDGPISNETYSLSMPTAARHFKIAELDVNDDGPSLVLLSSDGLSNSYVDNAAFLKVALDLDDAVRRDGPDDVLAMLPRWMADTTASGSGDDISVVVLHREPPFPTRLRAVSSQDEAWGAAGPGTLPNASDPE